MGVRRLFLEAVSVGVVREPLRAGPGWSSPEVGALSKVVSFSHCHVACLPFWGQSSPSLGHQSCVRLAHSKSLPGQMNLFTDWFV